MNPITVTHSVSSCVQLEPNDSLTMLSFGFSFNKNKKNNGSLPNYLPTQTNQDLGDITK